ncbi:(2Fe-2S) ferredoxin domain-containing protein [Paenibacillus senegalensis]|uniref:(2Fe-2S) ferredoxin domain-containing protein n=1 Tax=Paenibacillus senegalensis TaxID=1465766 RepID=UPI000289434C|nr:(2Fe-2S) ferredoxin domain-containing protein [Paenibacillus senegalensis]
MDRDLSTTRHHILICNGGSCMREGGEELTLQLRDEIAVQQAKQQIHTSRTRCNGRCGDACVVIVYPEGTWYRNMTPESGRELVRSLCSGATNPASVSYYYKGQSFVRGEETCR